MHTTDHYKNTPKNILSMTAARPKIEYYFHVTVQDRSDPCVGVPLCRMPLLC